MDVDPSMLDRQAGMLSRGFQNIKRRIHRWANVLLKLVAPRETLNRKFWMPVAQ